jgi:hypothetical protein
MSKEPIFVGYFTPGAYEQQAIELVVSLTALGLEYDVVRVDDQGNWQRNTQLKPEVVLQFLQKYDGRRVVYIDVDAYVLHRPDMFWSLDVDFAAHLWDANELLSGTLFFRAGKATRDLVRVWTDLCRQYPETLPDGRPAWDQRCLSMAMRKLTHEGRLTFRDLPHSYCWMVGLSQAQRPGTIPIICHKPGDVAWKRKPTWRKENGVWLTEWSPASGSPSLSRQAK